MLDHGGWRGLFVAALVVQLVVLYWPRPVDAAAVPGLDKVVHVAIFAAAAMAGRRAGVPVRWLAAGLALHAVVSEVIQGTLLEGRSADPFDAVADLVGVAIGLAVARRLAR
ncbi:MAG TPA: hypothetical protein VFD41_12330 [Actinomycetales bacterium]|nr:hypothetical protein [Actinomycetales bacterium]